MAPTGCTKSSSMDTECTPGSTLADCKSAERMRACPRLVYV
jgi:hypothetical protein